MKWMFMPLRRYAVFSGRAPRLEYWSWLCLQLVVLALLVAVDIGAGLGGSIVGSVGSGTGVYFMPGLLGWLLLAFLFIPNVAVGVRRLHDLDLSGKLMLIGLIPFFGGIVLLYMFAQPGVIGGNRFGEFPDVEGFFG
jgi:uncharacterized membrane protein YhaH (DUF805 family)